MVWALRAVRASGVFSGAAGAGCGGRPAGLRFLRHERHRRVSAFDRRANWERLGLQQPNQVISVTGPQTEADRNVKRLGNPENKALTAAIKKAGRQRDWDGAAALFAEAKAPDALLYSALFHAADLCGRPGEAFASYEEVRRLGFPRNWVMITPLIKLAGRQGDLDRARDLVQEMREAGHSPDAFVCAVLVEAHKRAWDVRGALQVYTDMREEGVLVTAPLLSAVMSAVALDGDVAQTEALLQDARGQFQPNVVHFNCVLQACKRAGDADAALRVLHEDMPKGGAKPDTISYTSVLAALRRAGRPPADVDAVVGEMRAGGVPPDEVFLEEHLACIVPPGAQAEALESAPRSTLEALASAIRTAREAGTEPGTAAAALEVRLAAALGTAEGAGAPADWVRVVAAGDGDAGAQQEYYWDRASGRTQWQPPSEAIAGTVIAGGSGAA